MDIVRLKNKVKKKELKFYLSDGCIYCKNNKTQEIVIVGDYNQIKIDSTGIVIIFDNSKKKFLKDEIIL